MITKIRPNRRKFNRQRFNAIFFYCAMFALPLIQFGFFYIGVNLNSILLAFKRYNIIDGKFITEWVGFDNFAKFFSEFDTNSKMKLIVRNSFIVTGVSVFVVVPLNLIFSYYIYKKYFGSKFFQVVLFIPTIISEMVLVSMFKIFSQQVMTNVFHLTNVLDNASGKVFITCLCFSTFINLGASTLVYSNAMSSIPKSLMEASEIDGANSLRQFFSVVIPSIWPTIVSYLTLAFVGLSTNQISLFSFYSNALGSMDNKYWTMAAWSYWQLMKNSGSQLNYPYASAIGLILTLFVAPVAMILNTMLTKYGPSEK